ncbi:MAG: glycoside hydrolase family 2 TIM barrel-domain containing protein [Eubacteriales bacterium]|nr:glycoside hydrolase family 2 TIM barrel-domain containing protein [Eubacteriales bacterium]
MIRMFSTHEIRPQEELSESLWDFTPLEGEQAGQTRKVLVPGCWETLPGLRSYRGIGRYARRFFGGGNLRLEFKGVSHTAKVFLDGEQIAFHYNAYTPFSAVKPGVKEGEHLLEVIVDNRFTPESALHIPNDYMTYGGITRPVALERVGSAYLEWAHYTPFFRDGRWHCRAEVCVKGVEADQPADVWVRLRGKAFYLGAAAPGPKEEAFLAAELDLADREILPWSPETPRLYRAEAFLMRAQEKVDDLIDRIGFREIKVQGDRILLNGEALRIRGVCRHEDWEASGCALTTAQMQQDLNLLKDLGGNSVRTTHYPNDERFLDLCDEQGILVWEENHARGLVEEDMRNPHFEEQCEQVNREMVAAHYNHPAIYIWGILNECASETEYGRECYARQLHQLRSLDQSRPLTFATCRFSHDRNGENFVLNDICMDLPDVASFNMYPLWYFDCDVSRFLEQVHGALSQTAAADKPFLVSEIGAGAEYGYHADEEEKWSEEYQAAALERQLNAVLSDGRCTGVYIWQFADVRVSREWFGGRPRSHNNKGIVDEYRRPKLAYRRVREIFRRDSL